MTSLDRQAPCPSCASPVTFKFAGARSVVCEFCNAVVARTDRGYEMQGRMAALLELPSNIDHGSEGDWGGQRFECTGRIQLDRVGQASAPWQEFMLWFPHSDQTTWVAKAQGKWYATSEVHQPPPLPAYQSLRPGGQVNLGQYGTFVVAEVSQRKVVAGSGSLPNVPKPGVVTTYADISGQGGQFGTIDYGDGSEPAVLYMGKQFDPAEISLDSGFPIDQPQAETASCECPSCGANLPIQSQQTERVVCQYCGTASDLNQGNLSALGPSPKPPIAPYIPIGAKGNFRGADYVLVGFMIRSCFVEGVQYSWREYLLFGGESVGYRWLMEEDGKWSFVESLEAGEVMDSGNSASFRGAMYSFKQQVQANVDYVIGEFYWKVEIGESVEATEFQGPGGKVSRERSPREVVYTFVSNVNPSELAAFGVAPPPAPFGGFGGGGGGSFGGGGNNFITEDGELGPLGMVVLAVVLICICLILSMGDCGGTGGTFGGPSFGK